MLAAMVVGMCKVTVWGTHVHSHTHTHTSLQTAATEGMEGRVRKRGWGSRLFHNLCVCVCGPLQFLQDCSQSVQMFSECGAEDDDIIKIDQTLAVSEA